MLPKKQAGGDRRLNVFSPFTLVLLFSLVLLALPIALLGCENFDLPVDEEQSASTPDGGTAGVTTSRPDAGASGSSMDAGPAEEETEQEEKPEERKTDFVVAQASEDFIFVPNPSNHVVTVIDPQSEPLSGGVRYIPAGNRPTYVGVCSEDNVAIAIDEGAGRAAVIRVSRAAAPDPAVVEVGRGANAVAFSPRCFYALVYYDPEYVGDADRSGGYQEVSVIDLEKGEERSVRVTVGLRPRQIVFEKEGKGAFFVTEEGVSTVTFADLFKGDSDSALAEGVDFGRELEAGEVEIGLSPYGRFVTGYERGSSKLYLLDTSTDTMSSLDMVEILNSLNQTPDAGAPAVIDDAGVEEPEESEEPETIKEAAISQLAIASSGSFALAVIPDPGVVLMVKIPKGFENPSTIVPLLENEPNDSAAIDPNEMTALVYDRAGRGSYINVVDLEAEEDEEENKSKRVRLAGPVDEVHYSPDGNTALIIHNSEGAPWEPKATGYSALSVEKGVAGFHATSVRPGAFAFSAAARALFMILRDDALGTRQLLRVALGSLLVEPIDLERRPRGLGVIQGVERVLVDHEHVDGHVVLFDWTGAVTGSLVGFQIVDRIKE
jgi:DNA-binding beta-propeller fold protein YncE